MAKTTVQKRRSIGAPETVEKKAAPKYTQLATLPKTAARCKDEGIGLTEYQLRVLCKMELLPHVRYGHKFFVYWPTLLKFLESGNAGSGAPPANSTPEEYGKIEKIPEDLPPFGKVVILR